MEKEIELYGWFDFKKGEMHMVGMCKNCKYYNACGDSDRTLLCHGKEVEEEKEGGNVNG